MPTVTKVIPVSIEVDATDVEKLVLDIDRVTKLRIIRQLFVDTSAYSDIGMVMEFITEKSQDYPFLAWLQKAVAERPWQRRE